ncbi:MAG: hypothetical protein AAF608_09835 [Pseudomonadota bacterium]
MRPNFYAIDAIAFGFRFAITGLPTALRLGWLPFLIVTAASIQMTSNFIHAGIDPMETVRSGFGAMMDGGAEFEWEWQADGDYEDLSATTSVWGLLALLGYVFFIPAVVALYRQAANVETRGGFLPVFGGPEWRFLASFLVMPLAIALVALVLGLVTAAGVFAGEATGIDAITVVAGLVFVVAFLWFLIRFSLFQPHVAITNTLSVPAAVALTAGRIWKLLGTYILVGLILVLVAVAWSIVFGTAMAVSEFGSPAYMGIAVAGSAANVLISIIGYGIIGRITGDLLGTTEYDEPYTDDPTDEDDDPFEEVLAEDETDLAGREVRDDEPGVMSYADEPAPADGMLRRFDTAEELRETYAPEAAEPAPAKRRSSVKFLRTRFR